MYLIQDFVLIFARSRRVAVVGMIKLDLLVATISFSTAGTMPMTRRFLVLMRMMV
jgi:hypothetical protein